MWCLSFALCVERSAAAPLGAYCFDKYIFLFQRSRKSNVFIRLAKHLTTSSQVYLNCLVQYHNYRSTIYFFYFTMNTKIILWVLTEMSCTEIQVDLWNQLWNTRTECSPEDTICDHNVCGVCCCLFAFLKSILQPGEPLHHKLWFSPHFTKLIRFL